ncbi:MAG TPA: hypothetical protein VII56_03765 [Rhizomicrobium sp.]
MRVGVLDLLSDSAMGGWASRFYGLYFRKQFMAVTPQAVSVWCRALGHEVHYATYWGQADPLALLPADLDIVFFGSYTQSSALACALSAAYRGRGVLTAIGGPHSRSFPTDCQRFFDFVIRDCDKTLIDDILSGRVARGAIVSSGRPLEEFPSIEERMPEIRIAAFHKGKPLLTSMVPILSSIGCPYTCSFCVDWNSNYVALPADKLQADLEYMSRHYPKVFIAYHDPNFAVRYDETMDVIARIPKERRNAYLMESSLSILKDDRLGRLTETNCVYVAPGIESWIDYSNKAAAGAKRGRDKLERVIAQLTQITQHVAGIQANFLFGGDSDAGREPVELTKEFIARLPQVWPTINIPSPFGGTPLYDQLYREGRILAEMPFAFYYNPYLAITLKNYDALTYYDHLIEMHEVVTSNAMLARRLRTRTPATLRFVHALRTLATRAELGDFRRLRAQLASDPQMRAFHDGSRRALPEYYHRQLDKRLGRFAELFPREQRIPLLEPPAPAADVARKRALKTAAE